METPTSLRELGIDLFREGQFERALAVFSEAVRRLPADHWSRMLAARCFASLGERERAVTALHACAEGLLRRDYLLSAMAACKIGLDLNPRERRLRETLDRIHMRASRTAARAVMPPPLPPETLFPGDVPDDLMSMQGEQLSNKAIEVLAAPDEGAVADPSARPPLPLFAELEREAFVDLVLKARYRTYQPDEELMRQGEGGDSIFVLIAGKAEAMRQVEGEAKPLGLLSGGSIFGELSLLTGAASTATVTAMTELEIFEIRREDLNELARSHPTVVPALFSFAQQRMVRSMMQSAPLFQQIPIKERSELVSRFQFCPIQTNDRILVEGEPTPGLFVVLAGELVVQKGDPSGGVVSLGVLREGDVAGEISLLTGFRATATVIATRKTAAAFLDREAFNEVMHRYPNTRAYLELVSDRRLKQIGEALRPSEIIDADELVVEKAPVPESRG